MNKETREKYDITWDVDMMHTGCVFSIDFFDKDGRMYYKGIVSSRVLEIRTLKHSSGVWDTLIDGSMFIDPLKPTNDEWALIDMMYVHLSRFEKGLIRLAVTFGKIYRDDGSHEYAQHCMEMFIKDHFDEN